MKIVVTGATSFVGLGAVRELLHRGHQVYAVLREHSTKADLLRENGKFPQGLTILEEDLGNLSKLPERIPGGCDVFLHMGWRGAGSDSRKNESVQEDRRFMASLYGFTARFIVVFLREPRKTLDTIAHKDPIESRHPIGSLRIFSIFGHFARCSSSVFRASDARLQSHSSSSSSSVRPSSFFASLSGTPLTSERRLAMVCVCCCA